MALTDQASLGSQADVLPDLPQTIIRKTTGLAALQLDQVWAFRELLYFLVWRDVKVRYKQTALGVLWIVLQPLIMLGLYYVIFGILLQVPSNGVPYPAFAFAALVPWTYFAGALGRASISLVEGAQLVTKVYFPRLLVPLSAVLAGLVDFAIAFVVLIVVLLTYQIVPGVEILLLPVFLMFAIFTALGFSLWLAALNVHYRDIKHLVPFIVQTWWFATPVMYATNIFPENFRWVLALNPMTGVVEGFRWALLGAEYPGAQLPLYLYGISVAISLIVLISGMFFFRSTERTFADIV